MDCIYADIGHRPTFGNPGENCAPGVHCNSIFKQIFQVVFSFLSLFSLHMLMLAFSRIQLWQDLLNTSTLHNVRLHSGIEDNRQALL